MGKAQKNTDPLGQAIQYFEKSTKTPSDYLIEQENHAEKNRQLLKILFDFAKSSGSHFQSESLPDELYVNQMDEEQIWQQLEMQNNSFWENCMADTCRLLAFNENKLQLNIKYADQVSDESAASEDEIEANNVEENQNESDPESDDSKTEVDFNDSESGNESDDSVSGNESMGLEGKSAKKHGKSVVDDEFFNLNEMEAFLDLEDKKELDRLNGKKKPSKDESDEDSSDEEIDYFDDIDSEDEENVKTSSSMMYNDFFDANGQQMETNKQIIKRKRSEREAKNQRKKHEMKQDLGIDDSEEENSDQDDIENDHDEDFSDENEENDENDDNEENQEKSEFDLRQDRLKKRIEQLEENALAEKPWQLKGEITSGVRPKNSLLEEVLDFETTARPPPMITEETTLCLEDIIKRRIKSKAWDDVERKIKPINNNQDYRKTLVLSQEKSKESLAQIYEKDYLEKVHKMNNVDEISKPDEPAEHTEIRKAIKDLFVKLDALSNFHFTAKPVAAEAKIITNIPAIEMEEVAPVAVSDATLLAPEEIKRRPVGVEIGKLERTDTDKKRERRKKKLKQKIINQQQDKRIEEKEKLGIKVTTKEKQQQLVKQVTKSRNVIKGKNTADDESRALKSSKNFFTQLQDNVTTVKSKSLGKKKKSASDLSQHESNAKRFKL